MTRRSKVALAIAVATGTVGSTLITAGAFAITAPPVQPAAAGCPVGTVLYQAMPAAATDPVTAATNDPADPYASASIDPDSFLCVVPGYGAIRSPQVTAPQPAQPVVNPPTPFPTPLPTPIATPNPDPGITGPAPGMIPIVPEVLDVPAPERPPVAADSPTDDRGPNDGGERPGAPQQGDDDDDKGKRVTRDEVIGRAVSWVLQQVPYSQVSWWTDSNGTYRQDCSGYVSMAWNLNQRTNYWTGNLASVSHRIATKSLKPGDILLLPRSHVVIFGGWANSAKTKFHLYEEYSRGKPARYLTGADLGYYLNRGYGAYRYDRIADVERGSPGPHSTVYELATHSTENGTDTSDDPLVAPGVDIDDGLVDIATQVPGEPWTPERAVEAETEAVAPEGQDEQVTPDAVPLLPVDTLVEVQLATDLRALPPDEAEPATSGSATALLAAGIGLLFLGFPLAAAARAGVWLPGVLVRREDSTS